jgi:hypothetical protein
MSTSYEWNRSALVVLQLASFTWRNVLEVSLVNLIKSSKAASPAPQSRHFAGFNKGPMCPQLVDYTKMTTGDHVLGQRGGGKTEVSTSRLPTGATAHFIWVVH